MRFEEVKNLIDKAEWANLYPNIKSDKVRNLFDKIIKDVETASGSESIEKLNDDEINLVESLVEFTIDDCLSAINKDDKQILSAIIEIFGNINTLYEEEIVHPRSMKVMRALISTRLSFDSELFLLTDIMKRITKVFWKDQPSDNLSRKYYVEFENYINNINHDDRY